MSELDYAFTLLEPFELWEWGVMSIMFLISLWFLFSDNQF